jgi:hypothetical protein
MEDAINFVLSRAVEETGKIIGIRLAIRLISDEIERVRSLNREIQSVMMTGSEIFIKINPGLTEKKGIIILDDVVCSIVKAYSGVIGKVANTLVMNVMKNAEKKFGKDYPGLGKMTKKLANSELA